MSFPPPAPENAFLAPHVELMRSSLRRLSGRELIDSGVAESEASAWLYHAPFAVVSHDGSRDPVFNYGNQAALELFEMSWLDFTRMPSRNSAEMPERGERARLLEEVGRQGYIADYAGVRVSSTGRRFRIAGATVWNLIDPDGNTVGQAAAFERWEFL